MNAALSGAYEVAVDNCKVFEGITTSTPDWTVQFQNRQVVEIFVVNKIKTLERL